MSVSPSSAPSSGNHIRLTSNSSLGGGGGGHHGPFSTNTNSSSNVRLPSVTLPRESFLDAQPLPSSSGRRVSITDPFLHAYHAPNNPNLNLNDPVSNSIDGSYSSASGVGRRGSSGEASALLSAPIKYSGTGTGSGLPLNMSLRPPTSGSSVEDNGTIGGSGGGVTRYTAESHQGSGGGGGGSYPYEQGGFGGSAAGGGHPGGSVASTSSGALQSSSSSSLNSNHNNSNSNNNSNLPAAGYRFGGGGSGSTTASPGPSGNLVPLPGMMSGGGGVQDAPSYYDYSIRRHSLTNQGRYSPSPRTTTILESGGGGGGSSLQNHQQPHQHNQAGGILKRKSSHENDAMADYPDNPYLPHNTYPSHMAQGPIAKRRGSSNAYDKMGNLSLADQRRDSMLSTGGGGGGGGITSWEEENRRGSGESYTSTTGSVNFGGGGGGYGGSNHPTLEPFDQRGSTTGVNAPSGLSTYSLPHVQRHTSEYGQSLPPNVSPHHRPSLSMGPPGSKGTGMDSGSSESYGRRPSTSSGAIQGQISPYGHRTMYSTSAIPAPPPPPLGGSRPSSMSVPPVIHSPQTINATSSSQQHQHSAHLPHNTTGSSSSSSYANLPSASAAWARAGPLPGGKGGPIHGGHGFIHSSGLPSSVSGSGNGKPWPVPGLQPPYGPGGVGGMKETPYSRSPELRVSHKLAERKRRKEMAQLFDELRESLPVDRGMKSSKWEILSKAVDYIVTLKEHNVELSRDNTMLRDHFGLGPGPQPGGPDPDGSAGSEEGFTNPSEMTADSPGNINHSQSQATGGVPSHPLSATTVTVQSGESQRGNWSQAEDSHHGSQVGQFAPSGVTANASPEQERPTSQSGSGESTSIRGDPDLSSGGDEMKVER